MSIINRISQQQNIYNYQQQELDRLMLKHRRSGYTTTNMPDLTLNKLYNLRSNCQNLYKELIRYNMVGHKISFTTEETININKMMESKDEYTLNVLKQIILSKLNE